MAARAMWKAVIRCDELDLPVKMYSAVEDRRVHFQLLHDQDGVRVRQRMVDPETDQTIPYQQMRKGIEIKRDEFVVFDSEELQSLQPEPSRTIEILGFVPAGTIDPQWYERPYWLGPDDSSDRYFEFAQALATEATVAIARWTLRGKEYSGTIRNDAGYLACVTLRHVEEVIPANDLEPPAGRELDEQEVKLAEQLVDALWDSFEPSDYHDQYRQRLMELIAAKQRGESIEVEAYEEEPATESLAESLRVSLQEIG